MDEDTPNANINEPSVPASSAEDQDPHEPSRVLSRPRIIAAGALLVVLVGLLVGFLIGRGEDPKPIATTTTSPTATTPPSTVETLPAGTSEIATVKDSVKRIKVLAAAPADWSNSDVMVVPTLTNAPPSSAGSAPEHEPIPTADSPVVGRYVVDDGWEFKNPGPFTPAQPLTFLVTERRGDWVKVLLPVRPNGTEGYVAADDVTLATTHQRIEIHVAEHRLVAYDGTETLVDTPIVTGVSFSPTPTGRFFVTDLVPYSNQDGTYGPYAFATNGYSETLDEFDDGVPVIALHGTNRPELMGQDRSNGCIRMPNEVVSTLAAVIKQGTPVYIWP